MKVSDRQQQGRAKSLREICPACANHYLKTFFVYDNTIKKWVKTGKVCPNELCTFSRKDKEESK